MQNKIQIEVLVESSKNCSRSRIVASPYYGMKILVATASDRANTVTFLKQLTAWTRRELSFFLLLTEAPHCVHYMSMHTA